MPRSEDEGGLREVFGVSSFCPIGGAGKRWEEGGKIGAGGWKRVMERTLRALLLLCILGQLPNLRLQIYGFCVLLRHSGARNWILFTWFINKSDHVRQMDAK